MDESIGVGRSCMMSERTCSKRTFVQKNYIVPIAVQIFFRPRIFFRVFWTVAVSLLCFEISFHEPVNVFL